MILSRSPTLIGPCISIVYTSKSTQWNKYETFVLTLNCSISYCCWYISEKIDRYFSLRELPKQSFQFFWLVLYFRRLFFRFFRGTGIKRKSPMTCLIRLWHAFYKYQLTNRNPFLEKLTEKMLKIMRCDFALTHYLETLTEPVSLL